MALHSHEEEIFNEIRKEFENDADFNRKTNKVTNYSNRRFIFGLIIIVAGVCSLLFSLSVLDGLMETIGGLVSFGLMVFGGIFGYKPSSISTVDKNGTLVLTEQKKESPFMQKLEREWEERRKREGLND